MSPRKPNMLEAFQASAKADQARQAEAEAVEGSAPYAGATPGAAEGGEKTPAGQGSVGAGGPFAGTTKPVTPEPAVRPDVNINPSDLMAGAPEPTDQSLRRALGGGAGFQLNNVQLPVLVVGVLVAMLAMFFLGRWFSSPSDSHAAGGGSEIGELAGTGDPTAGLGTYDTTTTDESGLTAADRAFLDRKNHYSVRAIQFSADDRGDELAETAYDYLCGLGLPAVAPITQGNIQIICVGAAPTRNAEIEQIRSTLRALPGPPPANEPGAFESAYLVNIEDQIDDEYRIGNP